MGLRTCRCAGFSGKSRRYQCCFAGNVIKEHDAGFTARHFAATGLVANPPDEIAAVFIEVIGRHFKDQHFTVESFRFVLRGDIGDDDAATFNVELGKP